MELKTHLIVILIMIYCHMLNVSSQIETATTTTSTPEENLKWYEYIWEDLQEGTVRYYILAGVFAIFLLIGFIACIDASCLRKNDFFKIGIINTFTAAILDLITDIFFIFDVYTKWQQELIVDDDEGITRRRNLLNIQDIMRDNDEYKISDQLLTIFIIAIGSLVIAVCISVFQLYFAIQTHWLYDDKIRCWLYNHTTTLYFASFICGSSFTSVSLFNSNMFGLDIFDMGLRNKHRLDFNAKKLYSILLFASIPQILMQIWYGLLNRFNLIVILAMIFSAISIIVTITSIITKKQMFLKQDYLNIRFDVTGDYVLAKMKKCQNNINALKANLSVIIGKNENVMELQRPYSAPNGLRIRIVISVIGGDIDETFVDDQYKEEQDPTYFNDILNEAISNGTLQKIIQNVWRLKGKPNIVNIKCAFIETELSAKKKMNDDHKPKRKVIIATNNNDKFEDDRNENRTDHELEIEFLKPISINVTALNKSYSTDDDNKWNIPKKHETKSYSKLNEEEEDNQTEMELENTTKI